MDSIEKDIQYDLDNIMETFDRINAGNVKITVSFFDRDVNRKRKITYALGTIHKSRSGPYIGADKVKDVIELHNI